jgi:hypothetical protein
MSRTVRDLVDAFRIDEERSFDPDAVWQGSLRRARQHTLRRRTAVALAAGVAAAAAVAAPSVVLTAGSPDPDPLVPAASGGVSGAPSTPVATPPRQTTQAPPAPTARDAWSETLRRVSEGGWLIDPTETSAHVQRANVVRTETSTLVASIAVYEPGVFDPSPVLGGARTTVQEAPAYFAWVPDPYRVVGDRPALAWQYAEHAWAVVWPELDTFAPSMSIQVPGELLEIASLVEIGEPEPIRLPFHVDYRPDGLVPNSVTHFGAAYPDRTVFYEYVDAPVDFWDPQREFAFPLHLSMRPADSEQWRPNMTIGGREAMRLGDDVIVAIDDLWLTFGSGAGAEPLPDEEIEQILTGMTFADWSDQSTWFDANTAT